MLTPTVHSDEMYKHELVLRHLFIIRAEDSCSLKIDCWSLVASNCRDYDRKRVLYDDGCNSIDTVKWRVKMARVR